jgi:threonyl-tRNA synthetase
MIHTAKYGSLERFFGILIEHYAGAFPLWISPIQVVVLPVSDKFSTYASKIVEKLINNEIRATNDSRNETLGYRIREAQMHKIPYMVIVGEKEQSSETVSLRSREGDELSGIKIEQFISMLKEKIRNKE